MAIKNSNGLLVQFVVNKLTTPYIMGTNGRTFTKSMYHDLVKSNPSKWFTAARLPKVQSCIGIKTTDCHGLIEWFIREQTGSNYDVTADSAFQSAKIKGTIDTIPEQAGICVRYQGHVGIYIGNGYVIEARGFSYGTCITKLKDRNWTHWYKHPNIQYTDKQLPTPVKVTQASDKYSVVWLQMQLNRQIAAKHISVPVLTVDGCYGAKTAEAVLAYFKYKGWSTNWSGKQIGKNTVKALTKV